MPSNRKRTVELQGEVVYERYALIEGVDILSVPVQDETFQRDKDEMTAVLEAAKRRLLERERARRTAPEAA